MENQYPDNYFRFLTDDNKSKLRAYEKVCLRIINTKNAIRFNNNCLRERLCPKSIKLLGQNGI